MQIAACRNHPEREAIGVCIACRTRVCAECSTKVDGINHCVDCLAKLGISRGDAPRARSSRAGGVLAAGALLATGAALTWALLEIALPG